jgi:hypothetical protein
VAKVGTSNQDRTISLKAAVRSCINKQQQNKHWLCLTGSAVILVTVDVICKTYIPLQSRVYPVMERILTSFCDTVSLLAFSYNW